MKILRNLSAQLLDILLDSLGGAFSDFSPIGQVHTAHTGLSGKLDKAGTVNLLAVVSHSACKLHGGFSFGSFVSQAGEGGTANQVAAVGSSHREKVRSQTIAVGNGAGLIQNHSIHVAAGFYRLTRHSDYVEPGNSVHTGDTNSGKQAADGGRNQADSQSDQSRGLKLHAGINTDGIQSHDHDHEDDGQGNQQSIQRDLVRSLFSGSALYQGDHPIKEAVSGV